MRQHGKQFVFLKSYLKVLTDGHKFMFASKAFQTELHEFRVPEIN